MYLSRIELTGFKSFANKTVLSFEPGVTCIVGPNGSGKSNVADAIRWVLGEQSMKNLRGSSREDVIFSGTAQKSRLGLAEVSLVLNNEDGQVPIELKELTITRRYDRSGESTYFLNGSRVRLLDIQELLAKAGFAGSTYSVVGQGMIDSVVTATPKERREIFEDAAGIRPYQIKRKHALSKLNASERNLEQVNAHLAELTPHVKSLKRQAGRAAKKEELLKERNSLRSEVYNHIWNAAQRRLSEVSGEYNVLQAKEQRLSQDVAEKETALDALEKASQQETSEEAQNRLAERTEQKKEHDRLSERLSVVRGRIQVEAGRTAKIDTAELARRIEDLEQALKHTQEDAGLAHAAHKEAQARATGVQKELAALTDTIQKMRTRVADLTPSETPALTLGSVQDRLADSLLRQRPILEGARACESLDTLKDALNTLEAIHEDLCSLYEHLDEATADAPVVPEELAAAREELEQLQTSQQDLSARAEKAKVDSAVAQANLDHLHAKKTGLEEELEGLRQRLEQATEAAKSKKKNVLLDELTAEQKELEAALAALTDTLAKLDAQIAADDAQDAERNKQVFTQERALRELQRELTSVRESLRDVAVRQARAEEQRNAVKHELTEGLGHAFEKAIARFEQAPLSLPEDAARERHDLLHALDRKIMMIGDISEDVLNEYKEANERFEFLTEQRDDIVAARAQLETVVKELDATMKQQFDAAFSNINDQFQKYFKILFNGGRATVSKETVTVHAEEAPADEQPESLAMDETSTISEDIIEITATPPGKKLTSLSMLSGGEKALTSIALILAIIHHNPSPFVVLDEVDAALDEANAERFAKVIASASDDAQFLLITHARATMQRARALYGVTMEESGVSKLLSVQLDQAEELADEKVAA